MTSRQLSRPLVVLGLWLACLAAAACGSLLGIEERRADDAESYPVQGYAGCVSGDCSGCLDVHVRECEVRSACAEAQDQNGCAGCVCESCTDELVDCQLEAGCTEIWECLRETRCDLSERAAGNCQEACGAVIQAHGGSGGDAWRSALGIRTCAASSACLGCLAPQVQQSARSCNQQNGCQDCENCFAQCLCSGERFGVCQEACGDQAPADCSEDDDCASCSNCFDACTCNGESFQQCSVLCSPPVESGPDPACTTETSCSECADCTAQCVCSGAGDLAACSVLCGPPGHDDACEFDHDARYSLCTDCTSCLASCRCSGMDLSVCMAQCGHHECCSTGSCGDGATACSCTSSADACFQTANPDCQSFGGCDSCACEQCPGELGVCTDTPGCQAVFDCMRTTECHGSACFDRCRGESEPSAFATAEALWACYHGSNCSCETEHNSISCPSPQGSVDCPGYESPSATLEACCMQSNSGSGSSQNEQVDILAEDDPCGLQLTNYYRTARACEPRQQLNPPRFELLETCDSLVMPGKVYNGATLRGCCRVADGTCGYYDDLTGLGCLSASVFGFTPQACP